MLHFTHFSFSPYIHTLIHIYNTYGDKCGSEPKCLQNGKEMLGGKPPS